MGGDLKMGEKIDFATWWFFTLGLLIISGLVFVSLNYLGIIGETIVERKVFENSYQKHEADKTAKTTYRAQLSSLRARLNNPNIDEKTKNEIQAQINAINILFAGKED